MSQISNDDMFTLIIHFGYEERLTSAQLMGKYGIKTVENVFDSFVSERQDEEDDNYIIAVSSKQKGKVTTEVYGSLMESYQSILSELSSVVEKSVLESHICIGNVTLAKSFDLVQALVNPGRYMSKPYFFFACHGVASTEIKTSPTGKRFIRFIIIELDSESG